MNKLETNEFVLAILTPFNFNKIKIDMDTKIAKPGENSLNLSSLEIVSFIVQIEDQFKIRIDFDMELFTVQDYVDYIMQLRQENPK